MGSRMWRALAGAAAAAVVYKATGGSARDALRVPLGLVVTGVLAGLSAQATQVKTNPKATGAHQRIDVLVPVVASTQATANAASSSIGGVLSGATYVPNASYASNSQFVNYGNGNLSSLATGNVNPAYSTPMGAVSGTVTAGELNEVINFVNRLVSWSQDIASQLLSHNFSSN